MLARSVIERLWVCCMLSIGESVEEDRGRRDGSGGGVRRVPPSANDLPPASLLGARQA